MKVGTIKMFCLPHAGGSASNYLPWSKLLPVEVVPIEYPGRGFRAKEPLCVDIDGIVQSVYESMTEKLEDTDDYMIYGHSMGSLIAYEVAHKLHEGNHKAPLHLILSGGKAPQRRIKQKESHKLPLHLFEEVVLEYGGKQTDQIFKNEELKNYFIPILRADIKIVEDYLYKPRKMPLECDLSILVGEEDESTTWNEVKEWSQITNGGCEFYYFNGGHFFIQEQVSDVIKTIHHILDQHHVSM